MSDTLLHPIAELAPGQVLEGRYRIVPSAQTSAAWAADPPLPIYEIEDIKLDRATRIGVWCSRDEIGDVQAAWLESVHPIFCTLVDLVSLGPSGFLGVFETPESAGGLDDIGVGSREQRAEAFYRVGAALAESHSRGLLQRFDFSLGAGLSSKAGELQPWLLGLPGRGDALLERDRFVRIMLRSLYGVEVRPGEEDRDLLRVPDAARVVIEPWLLTSASRESGAEQGRLRWGVDALRTALALHPGQASVPVPASPVDPVTQAQVGAYRGRVRRNQKMLRQELAVFVVAIALLAGLISTLRLQVENRASLGAVSTSPDEGSEESSPPERSETPAVSLHPLAEAAIPLREIQQTTDSDPAWQGMVIDTGVSFFGRVEGARRGHSFVRAIGGTNEPQRIEVFDIDASLTWVVLLEWEDGRIVRQSVHRPGALHPHYTRTWDYGSLRVRERAAGGRLWIPPCVEQGFELDELDRVRTRTCLDRNGREVAFREGHAREELYYGFPTFWPEQVQRLGADGALVDSGIHPSLVQMALDPGAVELTTSFWGNDGQALRSPEHGAHSIHWRVARGGEVLSLQGEEGRANGRDGWAVFTRRALENSESLQSTFFVQRGDALERDTTLEDQRIGPQRVVRTLLDREAYRRVEDSWGRAHTQIERDELGYVRSLCDQDVSGGPVATRMGADCVRFHRSSSGVLRALSYHNGSGAPVARWPFGIHELRIERDTAGRVVRLRYFDSFGQRTQAADGAWGQSFTYGNFGLLRTRTWLDVDGQPHENTFGFASTTYTYDEFGRWLRVAYDSSTAPGVLLPNGQTLSAVERTFAQEQVAELRFLGPGETPCAFPLNTQRRSDVSRVENMPDGSQRLFSASGRLLEELNCRGEFAAQCVSVEGPWESAGLSFGLADLEPALLQVPRIADQWPFLRP